MHSIKKVQFRFYATAAGNEPVRDWLMELPPGDRRIVGLDLKTVEFGWPIGVPLVKSIGNGLWEVRSSLPSKREARVIVTIRGGVLLALHAFLKTTRRTPDRDMDIARSRMS